MTETAPGVEVQEGAGIGHSMELVEVGLELEHGGKRVRSEEKKVMCIGLYTWSHFQTPHCSLPGMDPFLTGDSQKPSLPRM